MLIDDIIDNPTPPPTESDDQLPQTVVVFPDPNLDRPSDLAQPKNIEWFKSYVPIYNKKNNANVEVSDNPSDDEYESLVVDDYNESIKKFGLDLPKVNSIIEITPDAGKKIDDAKTTSVLKEANKGVKMASDILGIKFKPFTDVEDIKARADEFNKVVTKATTAQSKREQDKIVSGLNSYIDEFNKQTGSKIPTYKNYEQAKIAITPNKKGRTPFEQQLEAYQEQHPVIEPITLQPSSPVIDNTRADNMKRNMYEVHKAENERAEKAAALKQKVSKLSTTKTSANNFILDPMDLAYLNSKVRGSEQDYKDASEVTSKLALDKQNKANELMPEYMQLKSVINSKTEQGVIPTQLELNRYEALKEDIGNYIDASEIMQDEAKKRYIENKLIRSRKGSVLGGLARTALSTVNDLNKSIASSLLTIAPYISKDISHEDANEAMTKLNELMAKQEEFFTGNMATEEYQQAQGGFESAVNSVVRLLPYIAGSATKIPGLTLAMMTTSFAVDQKQAMLNDPKFKDVPPEAVDAIAFTKGLVSAVLMEMGLKIGGSGTKINNAVYDVLNNAPKGLGFNSLRSYVGRRAMDYISGTASNATAFGALSGASVVADKTMNDIVNLVSDKELFTPIPVTEMLSEAFVEATKGALTGLLLGAGTGIVEAVKRGKMDFKTFEMVNEFMDSPASFDLLKTEIRNQLRQKYITVSEYKEQLQALQTYKDIASQIPKEVDGFKRYEVTSMMLENRNLEAQKAGLSPLFVKPLDKRIAENNKAIEDIAEKIMSEKDLTFDSREDADMKVKEMIDADPSLKGVLVKEQDGKFIIKVAEEGATLSEKGNSIAEKIRSLKTPKGSAQTDFTMGLKDIALEEIAQLVNDGAVVAEAITKVLSSEKYANLDRELFTKEVMGLVKGKEETVTPVSESKPTSLRGVKYSDIVVGDKYLEDILSDNKLSEYEKQQVREIFSRGVDYFKFDKEGEQKFQGKFANPEDITDVADIMTGVSTAQESAFNFYNTKNYDNVKDAVNYIVSNPNDYSPRVVKAVNEIKQKLDNPSSSMNRLYAIDIMKELGIKSESLLSKETPTTNEGTKPSESNSALSDVESTEKALDKLDEDVIDDLKSKNTLDNYDVTEVEIPDDIESEMFWHEKLLEKAFKDVGVDYSKQGSKSSGSTYYTFETNDGESFKLRLSDHKKKYDADGNIEYNENTTPQELLETLRDVLPDSKILKNTGIATEYHKQKSYKNITNPKLVKAVESLLSKETPTTNEGTTTKGEPNPTIQPTTSTKGKAEKGNTKEVPTSTDGVGQTGPEKSTTILEKGKSIADKIRSLKSKKGDLQSDITGGLKDLIIEEIAQLVEDGATVAKAIEEAFKNSKYAKLNRDEIKAEIFNKFPITDKDFEKLENEKEPDRIKRLSQSLSERGYSDKEVAYITKGGIERIDKVERIRQENKIQENLNKILASIKNKPKTEAVQIAIDQLKWDAGSEIVLENAIRKFKAEHDVSTPISTPREKPITITVDEKKALVSQIKAINRSTKDVADRYKEVSKNIHDILKGHKAQISIKQLDAIQKRMGMLKVGTDASVKKYVDYVEKVLANAEYAVQVTEAKKLNKRIKKALKNDKIPISVRAVAKDFLTLDAIDVIDIEKHIDIGKELNDAMQSGGVRITDGNVIDKTRKAADVSKIRDYVDTEIERQPKDTEIVDPEMPAEDNIEEVKAYIKGKYDRLKNVMSDVLRTGLSIDGTQHDFTPQERSDINKLLRLDLNNFDDVKDWNEVTEALDHLLVNGDTGLIPHILNKYKIAVDSKVGIQTLLDRINGRGGMLRVTRFLSDINAIAGLMRGAEGSEKDYYREKLALRGVSVRRWDNMLKNFKDFGIFETGIAHVARGQSNYKSKVKELDAMRIHKRLFAENGYDDKKTLESKFKISAYLRQLEYESNIGNKKILPAIDYLNATIKSAVAGDHPIQGEALQMLRDVVDNNSVDGQISLEKLRSNMSRAEKEAVSKLQDLYKQLRPYHDKVAIDIRNKPFSAIDNYSHISAYNKKKENLTATEMQRYDQVLQGTESGTIQERTGKASPINLDPFSTANSAIRGVMLDYFMTNPFKTMEKIGAGFVKASVEKLESEVRGTPEYEVALKQKKVAQAMQDIFNDLRKDMLERSFYESSFWKDVAQLVAKRTVNYTLGHVNKLVSELTSNLSYIIPNAPKAFMQGSTKYLQYSKNDGGGERIMENLLSYNRDRLYPHGSGTASAMDTKDFDIATADSQNPMTPARRNALKAYYYTVAKLVRAGENVNEKMITSGDIAIARPLFFGTLATEFKKITGKEIDFEKVKANDIEYMDANETALKEATMIADRKVVDAAASKNPFVTAPKMSGKSSQLMHAITTYLRGFNMNEFEITTDAIIALQKGGKISRAEAMKQIAGVALRAGTYKAVQAKIAYGLTTIGLSLLDQRDDDEKEMMDMLNISGDDGLGTRREIAQKQIEQFNTESPRASIKDALMTDDEETVNFWKRASREPNTFMEDYLKGIAQQFVSMLTSRNFGNLTTGLITSPATELINEKLIGDTYDPYNDNLVYSKMPDFTKQNWASKFVENNLGPYGTAVTAPISFIEKLTSNFKNQQRLEDINAKIKAHEDGTPVENPTKASYDKLIDERKAVEKKIADADMHFAKDLTTAILFISGAMPSLKTFDKVFEKSMQPMFKNPSDWKRIRDAYEKSQKGYPVRKKDDKEKGVSEVYKSKR